MIRELAVTLMVLSTLTASWHGTARTAGNAGTCAAPRDTLVGRDTVTVHSRRGIYSASPSMRRWFPTVEDSVRLTDGARFSHGYQVSPVWTGAIWVTYSGYCIDSVWVTARKRVTSSVAPPPSCVVYRLAPPQ